MKDNIFYTCSRCNGVGETKESVCFNCFGAGKVDWITNILGSKREMTIMKGGEWEE